MSVESEIIWGDSVTEAQRKFCLEGFLFEARLKIVSHIDLNKPLTGSTFSMEQWYGFKLMLERKDPLIGRLPPPSPPDTNDWPDRWEDEEYDLEDLEKDGWLEEEDNDDDDDEEEEYYI